MIAHMINIYETNATYLSIGNNKFNTLILFFYLYKKKNEK
jgi:hypothetical protein